MAKSREIKESSLHFRATLPRYFRLAAIALLAVSVVVVGVGVYRSRTASPFKLKSEHTQLSTEVIAEVNGYERLETENGANKYLIKADYAKTFSDNHQELTNLYLESYDDEGNIKEILKAERALYVPGNGIDFTAYLNGNVKIETNDGLKIAAGNATYERPTQSIEADEGIVFERDMIRGSARSAHVDLAAKRVDLVDGVQIESFDTKEKLDAGESSAVITAAKGSLDQTAGTVSFENNVVIKNKGKDGKNSELSSGRAVAKFGSGDDTSRSLKSVEMFDTVKIVSSDTSGGKSSTTTINAGYASYDLRKVRYELRNSVNIDLSSPDGNTQTRSNEAAYEPDAKKLALFGAVEVTKGGDVLSGEKMYADLYDGTGIKNGIVRGNAGLVSKGETQTTTINAPELNASFSSTGIATDASSVGISKVVMISNTSGGNETRISSQSGIGVTFKGAGLIDKIRTDGRTTVDLGGANTAPKKVIADTVRATFASNGKDLARTEAVGNAEFYLDPLGAAAGTYKTKVTASRFDCDYFGTGNAVRTCTATGKTKTLRTPSVQQAGRGEQTLASEKMVTTFDQSTGDIANMESTGNVKFTELDRTATAQKLTFSGSDEIVRLRGGEPVVWDSKSRAKAVEIDWDTKNNRSLLRRSVSTTYYSRGKMNDASPFSSSDKPVYITSETAEIDHRTNTAIYEVNARAWQENNYVRGDKIRIEQANGRFFADGKVQTMLYNSGPDSANVPTSASATSMIYHRDQRLLQYRQSVDIRQASDRLTGETADIYLDENNQMTKLIAENNVVITQPGKKAVGDWVQYTTSDDNMLIRGNPATVNDGDRGSTSGGQLSFNMKSGSVSADGRTKPNTSGRTRSVYKIKPAQ